MVGLLWEYYEYQINILSSINRFTTPDDVKIAIYSCSYFCPGRGGQVQPPYKGWRADRPLTGARVTMAATPAALLLATLALALTHGAHVEHEHQPEVTSVLTNIGLQQG